MRVSTKSQYGLRAMIYLAKNKNRICPLKEISKKEGIPFDYLEKIISKLEKKGLVKAKKGVHGGYFLAKKPSEIKIGELIESLEEKPNLVKCLRYFCPRSKRCSAKFFWQKLNKSINSTLNSVTLADLI
jgi:Rrf2 family protein